MYSYLFVAFLFISADFWLIVALTVKTQRCFIGFSLNNLKKQANTTSLFGAYLSITVCQHVNQQWDMHTVITSVKSGDLIYIKENVVHTRYSKKKKIYNCK